MDHGLFIRDGIVNWNGNDVFSVFQVMNQMKMMSDDGSEWSRRMQVGGLVSTGVISMENLALKNYKRW